ncbi:MAG: glycosyltransferase [Verrucomicrobia bacterium]|nr:glycosyltransferase [Verrucomicrobiota bacterium]
MSNGDEKRPPLTCTVLPTANERDNVRGLILGILRHAITPHRVVVVDDDSPDGTGDAVEQLMKDNGAGAPPGSIRLIRRVGERGLTTALQAGIDLAIDSMGADLVTWMDCDMSMLPADVARLVGEVWKGGADIAVGSRWIRGGADRGHGARARMLSWLINRFAQQMLGRQIRDYTSGFIAARADVLRAVRLRGDYGEYCIDFLVRAIQSGYRVHEVPYVCMPRGAGESKTGATLWDYLVKGRKYVATVWWLSRSR